VPTAQPLRVAAFDSDEDPLAELRELPQGQYIRWYLADLGAKSVLVEPAYFDRDYLSEFAAFYCTSTAGYPNVCVRVHYFDADVDRDGLERAVAGDEAERDRLQAAYLGFIVLRPIPKTPLGRTVLRAYPDQTPDLPRVVDPFRRYTSNIAGLTLRVDGLAWQQQDVGVGACATVALWSMLHSSAFDDRHVVPTTAEVTRIAHGPGLSTLRAFPSKGLNFGQLVATLRDSGFAPLVVPGDVGGDRFRREHFSAALAAFIRSGYPAIIAGAHVKQRPDGSYDDLGGHAVCAVGFRQASASPPAAGSLEFEDAATQHVYLHDDNLGPAARFHVESDGTGTVLLRADPPPARHALTLPDPTAHYPLLRPSALLAAAHDDVRLSPDILHARAVELGTTLIAATGGKLGLAVSSRLTRLPRYVREELGVVLRLNPAVLGRTRLALWETVPPMSLHIGVVRFAFGAQPLMDVLFDTTDSVPNLRAFCHVAYEPALLPLVAHICSLLPMDFGVAVAAF
jgi:hypothetical protein